MSYHDRTRTSSARAGSTAWRRLALAGLVASLLAACSGTGTGGQGGDSTGPGASAAPPTSATRFSRVPDTTVVPPSRRPPEAAPPTTSPLRLDPKRKPEVTEPPIENRELMKLRGRIVDGVEPGCVVLQAEGGGTWQLLDLRGQVMPAGLVQVTGYAVAGLATTCQQGRPLRVVSILAL